MAGRFSHVARAPIAACIVSLLMAVPALAQKITIQHEMLTALETAVRAAPPARHRADLLALADSYLRIDAKSDAHRLLIELMAGSTDRDVSRWEIAASLRELGDFEAAAKVSPNARADGDQAIRGGDKQAFLARIQGAFVSDNEVSVALGDYVQGVLERGGFDTALREVTEFVSIRPAVTDRAMDTIALAAYRQNRIVDLVTWANRSSGLIDLEAAIVNAIERLETDGDIEAFDQLAPFVTSRSGYVSAIARTALARLRNRQIVSGARLARRLLDEMPQGSGVEEWINAVGVDSYRDSCDPPRRSARAIDQQWRYMPSRFIDCSPRPPDPMFDVLGFELAKRGRHDLASRILSAIAYLPKLDSQSSKPRADSNQCPDMERARDLAMRYIRVGAKEVIHSHWLKVIATC